MQTTPDKMMSKKKSEKKQKQNQKPTKTKMIVTNYQQTALKYTFLWKKIVYNRKRTFVRWLLWQFKKASICFLHCMWITQLRINFFSIFHCDVSDFFYFLFYCFRFCFDTHQKSFILFSTLQLYSSWV